jgi:hypothetical protein
MKEVGDVSVKENIHILADVCNAQVSDTKRVNLLDNNVD